MLTNSTWGRFAAHFYIGLLDADTPTAAGLSLDCVVILTIYNTVPVGFVLVV